MGEGNHARVVQMEAAEGAAILYDARLWHRQCAELNTSGHDRIALLSALTPGWVPPMIATDDVYRQLREDTGLRSTLDARELAEAQKLFSRDGTDGGDGDGAAIGAGAGDGGSGAAVFRSQPPASLELQVRRVVDEPPTQVTFSGFTWQPANFTIRPSSQNSGTKEPS